MSKLDREISSALSGAPDKLPLYGHTSEATAYLVPDYPYGRTVRTEIRYWLESKPAKGWRFVSQTKNPKTGSWNKSKASTYTDWAAAMYLDGQGHVQWTGVGPYTDEKKALAFVEAFPGADMRELRKVVPAKVRHLRGMIDGAIFFTINGVRQPQTEGDLARLHKELAVWEEIGELLGRSA